MIFTIDIGNSNIVLAIFERDEIIKKWRIITDKSKSKDEYSIIIQQLMKADEVDYKNIRGVVLSSVVPEITGIFKDSLKFIDKNILIIGDRNIKTNLTMKKSIQREVGSDILMNIVAGKKRFKENFIIIDMGTATTFDIAVENGIYAGSIITAGINLANEGTHKACPQLPLIEIKKPDKFFGHTTMDSLKSGMYYGYIGTIKEITTQIKKYFKKIKFSIYLTGGLSPVFVQDLEFIDGIYPDITSEGLNEVWNINMSISKI